jgi:glutamine phosphoribosylpyrophosphate amidotransferase
MCGITGIVAQRNIGEELFEGMQNLEYRGYDSAGIAVLCDGRLEVRKDAGKLAEVEGQQQLSAMRGYCRYCPHPLGDAWGRLSGQCASACQCGRVLCLLCTMA